MYLYMSQNFQTVIILILSNQIESVSMEMTSLSKIITVI